MEAGVADMLDRIERLLQERGGAQMASTEFRKEMVENIRTALRQPSTAMINAGREEMKKAKASKKTADAADVWRAMIDSA
jgi:hypothetical protein